MVGSVQKPFSGINSIDSLLNGGWKWDATTVVYFFPNTKEQFPTATEGFDPLTTMQRDMARYAFHMISGFTPLNLVEGTTSGTINVFTATKVGSTDIGPGAKSSLPDGGVTFVRSVYNPTSYDSPLLGTYASSGLFIHEIGHTLGLKHPHELDHGAPLMDVTLDAMENTMMSYKDSPGDEPYEGYGSTDFPQSYMMLDIAALQYLYGANFTSNGNTVYKWTPTIGAGFGSNFVVNGAEYEPNVDLAANVVFRTIWDPGGNDTYDFSLYTTKLKVDLRPGSWTSLGTQLAVLEDSKSPPGNIANALLYNNDSRSLIENATGGSNDDYIQGNSAANLLKGMNGADVIFGDLNNDQIEGGSGVDRLNGEAGEDILYGGTGGDILKGGDQRDHLYGEADNDQLFGEGDTDWLDGGAGQDTLAGGPGDDFYYVDNSGDVVTDAVNEGTDTVYSSATYTIGSNTQALELTGAAPINGTGSSGHQTITGNNAANVIDGGTGADTMVGKGGADTYRVDDTFDEVFETIDGGTDTVIASFDYGLRDHSFVENLTLMGNATTGTGNELANHIIGNARGNLIEGLLGFDTLEGGLGDDLYVLRDRSVIDHGGGNVDLLPDSIVEQVNGGVDSVDVFLDDGVFYTLPDNVENATVFHHRGYTLTGNALGNTLTGNDSVNTIVGLGGNDVLNGGVALDQLIGGTGNDTYQLDDVTTQFFLGNPIGTLFDTVTEKADEGIDTVRVGRQTAVPVDVTSYLLSDNVENAVITGSGAFGIDGNALANRVVGNAGNNIFDGMAGDDTFVAGFGSDVFDGGAGVDTIDVGDTPVAGGLPTTHTVVLLGDQPSVVLKGNSSFGTTTIRNVENVRGWALRDFITGDSHDNTFLGRAGLDVLDGGDGSDTADYSDKTASVSVTLNGSTFAPVTVNGNAEDNIRNIENLIGSSVGDHLTGDGAANTFRGSGGVDVMDGGGGIDTLDLSDEAVAFNLTLNGIHLANVVTTSGATLDSERNFENVIGGSAADTITGDGLTNSLEGGGGADRLDGKGGADTMTGGAGDDTFLVDNAGDLVVEDANQGTDTVIAAVSYTLGQFAQVEILRTPGSSGAAAIDLTGNMFVQALQGNSAANRLDGKGGADSMYGFAGNDTYFVDNARDKVIETANSGSDQVIATVSYALAADADVELLRTTGSSGTYGVDLSGNALANRIQGNAAANIINGGSGNDTLTGFGGNDFFRFNTSLGPANFDHITDFDPVHDTIQVENLIFTKLSGAVLISDEFRVGTAAADASDRIIYNQATGVLTYDFNGNAAGGATAFAIIDNKAKLTFHDFVVI